MRVRKVVREPQVGLKVFSATVARERDVLGERITSWIRANPQFDLLGHIVTQSSDRQFHCLAITLVFSYTELRPPSVG